jgi:hypothetical protein
MREQPRRDWHPAAKRRWVTPVIRELELTDDVLRLFGSNERIADALEGLGHGESASATADGGSRKRSAEKWK